MCMRDALRFPTCRGFESFSAKAANTKIMKFGPFTSAQANSGDLGPESGQGFRDYLDFNVEAEALGFHSSFLVEHHFTGWHQVSSTLMPRTSRRIPSSRSVAMSVQRSSSTMALMFRNTGLTSRAATAALAS